MGDTNIVCELGSIEKPALNESVIPAEEKSNITKKEDIVIKEQIPEKKLSQNVLKTPEERPDLEQASKQEIKREQSVDNLAKIGSHIKIDKVEQKSQSSFDKTSNSNSNPSLTNEMESPILGNLSASGKRHHNRKSLFDENERKPQSLFSVKGTEGLKINRHRNRDRVTAFPSGCMGIEDDPPDSLEQKQSNVLVNKEKEQVEDNSKIPSIASNEKVEKSTLESDIPGLKKTSTRRRPSSAVARNPLTGEGYCDTDFIRHNNITKKKDGNPVLGQGYKPENARVGKIPPGGYSKGLW